MRKTKITRQQRDKAKRDPTYVEALSRIFAWSQSHQEAFAPGHEKKLYALYVQHKHIYQRDDVDHLKQALRDYLHPVQYKIGFGQ